MRLRLGSVTLALGLSLGPVLLASACTSEEDKPRNDDCTPNGGGCVVASQGKGGTTASCTGFFSGLSCPEGACCRWHPHYLPVLPSCRPPTDLRPLPSEAEARDFLSGRWVFCHRAYSTSAVAPPIFGLLFEGGDTLAVRPLDSEAYDARSPRGQTSPVELTPAAGGTRVTLSVYPNEPRTIVGIEERPRRIVLDNGDLLRFDPYW